MHHPDQTAGPASETGADGAGDRVARMFASEQLARNRLTAIAVTWALVVIAPVVLLISGIPDGLFYVAPLPLFAGTVWLQYRLARRHGPGARHAYVVVAVNFILLALLLTLPNPISADPTPAPLLLRQGGALYFFIMLAALAFSFSPRVVMWGGFCAAVSWSLGCVSILSLPGVTAALDRLPPLDPAWGASPELRGLNPAYVDPGLWIQQVMVMLTVAGMLAMVVRGSRRLVLRQARLERRGANLARYLPAQMAERMAEADSPFAVDREVVAAVLFTDVVGFTGWAESRPPHEVMRLLREAHGLVAEAVFRAGGVLDKFIGDGAMASFGAAGPMAQGTVSQAGGAQGGGAQGGGGPADSARRALGCIDEILSACEALNRVRAARGDAPLRLSLGVHLGPVVIGDVGSSGRMELATVGDSVNVASRLEALTRELGCAACASDAVIEAALGDAARGTAGAWREVGARVLTGRAEPTGVWTRSLSGNP